MWFYSYPLQAYCDMETDGGGWTVFQRRQDGSVDFKRSWVDYENGFGDLTGEFWLGLSKIHRLTKEGSNTLRVDLEDFDTNTAYAKFSSFNVGGSATEYVLSVGGYSGSAGDSLTSSFLADHNGRKFSAKDNDNDNSSDNCARDVYPGGWWFNRCFLAHLNGVYHQNPSISYAKGIVWYSWKGWYYSLKFTEMKTRHPN